MSTPTTLKLLTLLNVSAARPGKRRRAESIKVVKLGKKPYVPSSGTGKTLKDVEGVEGDAEEAEIEPESEEEQDEASGEYTLSLSHLSLLNLHYPQLKPWLVIPSTFTLDQRLHIFLIHT